MSSARAIWEKALFQSPSALLISRAGVAGFTRHEPTDALTLEKLTSLIGSPVFVRINVSPVCGQHIIVYADGYVSSDKSSMDRYNSLPANLDASAFLQPLGLGEKLRGTVIILAGNAIHSRDLDITMRASNALTLLECYRDHKGFISEYAEKEWERVEGIYKDGVVPALSSTKPDAAKVAWMLRIMEVGMARDKDMYAAVMEARAKNPLMDNAMSTLAHVAHLYQTGEFEDFDTTAPLNPHRPTKEPLPAGWSKRYKQVIH